MWLVVAEQYSEEEPSSITEFFKEAIKAGETKRADLSYLTFGLKNLV